MDKKIGFFEGFWVFFKIGLLTIGGSYAMLPLIIKETVEGKKWFDEEEVIDCFALAQSVPGAIAVNTATLLGYKKNGIKGAIALILGIITPSVLIILIIADLYDRFEENIYFSNALKGIRVAVLSLLIGTVFNLGKKSIQDYWGAMLAITAFILISFLDVSPGYVILAGIVASILIYYKKGDKNGSNSS